MSENNDKQLEDILYEIKAYVDKLNRALEIEIPEEIDKNNENFEKIIQLAGELNASLKK